MRPDCVTDACCHLVEGGLFADFFFFLSKRHLKSSLGGFYSIVDYQQGASQMIRELLGPLKCGDVPLPI